MTIRNRSTKPIKRKCKIAVDSVCRGERVVRKVRLLRTRAGPRRSKLQYLCATTEGGISAALLLFLRAVEREFQRRPHLPLALARARNGCEAARIARLVLVEPVTLPGWPNCGVFIALKASR